MLAHGADFAIFFFPAAFGIGLWMITRKKKEPDGEVELAAATTKIPREPAPQIVPESVPEIVPERQLDGAARLRAAMRQVGRPADPDVQPASPLRAAVGDPAVPIGQKPSRRSRPKGPARLRLLIDAEDASGDDARASNG